MKSHECFKAKANSVHFTNTGFTRFSNVVTICHGSKLGVDVKGRIYILLVFIKHFLIFVVVLINLLAELCKEY